MKDLITGEELPRVIRRLEDGTPIKCKICGGNITEVVVGGFMSATVDQKCSVCGKKYQT